jgi:hypothetical protein
MNSSENVLATGASTNGSAAMFTAVDVGTEITNIYAYNADTSAHPLTVTLVRSGTSLGDASNVVLSSPGGDGFGIASVPAKGLWIVRDHLLPHIELEDGDAIQYTCDGTHFAWYVTGA